ncbi:MAG TPA: AbrB/MazE/SpoVT family DNA-binding domain-containing protein [Povalibacter sp.]|uniref:AbrB/MazE/SpoVT family DNA-binding domain-containing protein n=1 Tax=Povalibacter sp. TaxID=1962978 RepID=UPI002D061DF3|nr:AbrB/MazE/SpoVT family DNA-binding domain-containing protein [Povalibacter sp.]HMN43971.1 AbrB/MazE/SpoVT family DNA-binding domain-containing protein [Povalibacter sp.]
MKVAKWGNSLAVRLPAPVVDALGLKEGDDIEIRVADKDCLIVNPAPTFDELLARARQSHPLLPKDFRFNRDEANER